MPEPSITTPFLITRSKAIAGSLGPIRAARRSARIVLHFPATSTFRPRPRILGSPHGHVTPRHRGASRLCRGAPNVGGLGAISEPPQPRDIEERHGFAGALRTLGVWGPSRGPHKNRRNIWAFW